MLFHDLEVPVPADWGPKTELMLFGPNVGNFKPSIAVTRTALPKGVPLEQVVDELHKLNEAAFSKVKVLAKGKTKLGDASGLVRDIQAVSGGVALFQRLVYVPVGGTLYTIAFTDLGERFGEAARWADQALAAMKLRPTGRA
jgi:hypothetical protein